MPAGTLPRMDGTVMATVEAACPTCGRLAVYDERRFLDHHGHVVRMVPLVWRCPTGCEIRYTDLAALALRRDTKRRG